MRGALDSAAGYFLFPLLLYGLVPILTVQIPDVEVDRPVNKRTWTVRYGRGSSFTLIGLSLLAATGYFFVLALLDLRQFPVDFRLVGLLSLIPLVPGLWGWLQKPTQRAPATRIAIRTLVLLAFFAILLDVYLVILLRQ
jgi:1,4-dihydroxy-2-naphthoate octaprenyltransferase